MINKNQREDKKKTSTNPRRLCMENTITTNLFFTDYFRPGGSVRQVGQKTLYLEAEGYLGSESHQPSVSWRNLLKYGFSASCQTWSSFSIFTILINPADCSPR